MKHFLSSCTFLLLTSVIFAQTPDAINYQAIARTNGGVLLINSSVTITASILDGSATGTVLYSETHNPTTSGAGLFAIKVGKGLATAGLFKNVDWGTGNIKWLRIEMAEGGGGPHLIGASEILAVPYAIASGKAHDLDNPAQRIAGVYLPQGGREPMYVQALSSKQLSFMVLATDSINLYGDIEPAGTHSHLVRGKDTVVSDSSGVHSHTVKFNRPLVREGITFYGNINSGTPSTFTIPTQPDVTRPTKPNINSTVSGSGGISGDTLILTFMINGIPPGKTSTWIKQP